MILVAFISQNYIQILGSVQVCLLSAANVATKHMGTVVYLDTGNSFSPERIVHFVGDISDHAFDQVTTIRHHFE